MKSPFAGGQSDAPAPRWVAGVLGVAGCYFIAARLGLLLAFEKSNASAVWPAAGVALGALLLFGWRLWPGIFLGAFLANVVVFLQNQAAPPIPVLAVSAGVAVGNTLEALAGFWLLRTWLRVRNPLNQPEDVFRFGVVALASCLVSALIGPALISSFGLVRWDRWPTVALTWWLGDATGILTVTPLVLAGPDPLRPRWNLVRRSEAALIVLALITINGFIFNLFWPAREWGHWKFFSLAPLLWVATRFGRRETAWACFLFSALAVAGTVHGRGGVGTLSLTQALLSLQSFVGFGGLTALVIAAAAAQRKEAENSRRLVVEAAPNGMVMVDAAGQISLVNAQMERLFGYSRDELLGQSIEMLIPQRLRAGHSGLRQGFMAHPQARPMGAGRDLFGRRRDGSEFPVEIGLNPLQTAEGRFVLASVIDITARKEAEVALRESVARFRVIADTVPSMLFTATAEGTCDYTSRSFQEYLGATPDETLFWMKALHPDDLEAANDRWQQAIPSGKLWRMECRLRRHDGQYRWFLGKAHPVHEQTGRIVTWVGALTDIDEEKQARERLEATVGERTAALRTSLNSMEELLYTIAHDLRAPNRAMQGFAQILQLSYRDQLDEAARDYLDRISAAAARNDQMISDLLAYGQISHEAVPLAPVDIRQAIEVVLNNLEGDIQQRCAQIHLGEEWPHMIAYEPMFKQILTNFITNALKFVPPEMQPQIFISAARENGRAVVRIKDNGIGIDPGQMEKIFKPFIRLPNGLEAPGTGMGLAIVRKAAQRMHGEVGAESTAGMGSCFWLALPEAVSRSNRG